jgi:hypothetical protein
VPVQSRQAGQLVRCECGNQLEVPTIRGLSQLEQRQGAAAVERPAWTPRKAMISLGVLITLIGLGFTGYLYWKMPNVDPVARGREIETMPAYQIYQWWRYYERGIPQSPSDEFYITHGYETYLRRWSYFTIGIALVGLLVIVIGAILPAFARGRPSGSARR